MPAVAAFPWNWQHFLETGGDQGNSPEGVKLCHVWFLGISGRAARPSHRLQMDSKLLLLQPFVMIMSIQA